MKKYVLGFAFSLDRKSLVLRPEWQAGLLNGVGGKIEDTDMNPDYSMVREFEEETGVSTRPMDWECYAIMEFNNDIMGGSAIVYVYRMFSNVVYDCRTVEEEQIGLFAVDILLANKREEMMDNLPTLINLALGEFDMVNLVKY